MDYEGDKIEAMNRALCQVIEGNGGILEIVSAAENMIPFTAAFCVINQKGQPPVYLGDTYPEGPAKEAVQSYVVSTYLLNPVYNAILDGLKPGLHRMADLAPDNWRPAADTSDVLFVSEEEIGYRTPGWPLGLEELVLIVDLPDKAMAEISFARLSSVGGFTPLLICLLYTSPSPRDS